MYDDSRSDPQIVYVLGSTRSGTSAIRNALAQTRYRGAGEGHFIGLIHELERTIADFYAAHAAAAAEATLLSQIPQDALTRELYKIGRRAYTEKYGEYLIDKTPNIRVVRALGTIERMWSNVRLIFCRRRGIDNVLSKQRKWPNSDFGSLCREWTDVNREWIARKSHLSSPRIEIDFFDLESNPEAIARQLASFLQLTDDEGLSISNYLLESHPESTNPNQKSFTKFTEVPWSFLEKEIFLAMCSETMSELGYGMETYWLPGLDLDRPRH